MASRSAAEDSRFFEPDRILPDLPAGNMRREINRNRRPRVDGYQFLQVISAEHRSVRKGSAFRSSEPSQPFPGRLPAAMLPPVAVSSLAPSYFVCTPPAARRPAPLTSSV